MRSGRGPLEPNRPVSLRSVVGSPYYQSILNVMECEVGGGWLAAGTAGQLYRRFMEANKQLQKDNRPARSVPGLKDLSMVLPSLSGSLGNTTHNRKEPFVATATVVSMRRPSYGQQRLITKHSKEEKVVPCLDPIETKIFCTDHIDSGRSKQHRLILERNRNRQEAKRRHLNCSFVPKRQHLDGQVLADWLNIEKQQEVHGLVTSPSRSLRKAPRRFPTEDKSLGRCQTELPSVHPVATRVLCLQQPSPCSRVAVDIPQPPFSSTHIRSQQQSPNVQNRPLLPYLRQYSKEPPRIRHRPTQKCVRSHYISDSVLVKCREIRSIYRTEKQRCR